MVNIPITQSEATLIRDVLKRHAPSLVPLVLRRRVVGSRGELEQVVEALFKEYGALKGGTDAGSGTTECLIDELIGRITHRLILEFGSVRGGFQSKENGK